MNEAINNSVNNSNKSVIEHTPIFIRYKTTQIIDIKLICDIAKEYVNDIHSYNEYSNAYYSWLELEESNRYPLDSINIWDGKWIDINSISSYHLDRSINVVMSDISCIITSNINNIPSGTNIQKYLNFSNINFPSLAQPFESRFTSKCKNCNIQLSDDFHIIYHKNKCKQSTLNTPHFSMNVNLEEAELLGILIGNPENTKSRIYQFITTDNNKALYVEKLWYIICRIMGKKGNVEKYENPFDDIIETKNKLRFEGYDFFGKFSIHNMNKDGKKIPIQILNGNVSVKYRFLQGYNYISGGIYNARSSNFERHYLISSSLLTQGMLFLLKECMISWKLRTIINQDGDVMYCILINPVTQSYNTINEIVEIENPSNKGLQLYSINTSHGILCCGVGIGKIFSKK